MGESSFSNTGNLTAREAALDLIATVACHACVPSGAGKIREYVLHTQDLDQTFQAA